MDQSDTPNPGITTEAVARLGTQLQQLQSNLDKIGKGMTALGDNAVQQSRDSENIAAHLLALEAIFSVVLRQIPVDITEVQAEAGRRFRKEGNDGDVDPLVLHLAEDLIKRSKD